MGAPKKKYELTPAHRKQLGPWKDKWVANAMSTVPMTDAERAATREAIRGLYLAANLKPPPDERIVFVPSPFVLRFAGGFAAAIWHLRKSGQVGFMSDATDAATRDATVDATYAATVAATRAATSAATSAATRAATVDATYAATVAATSAATSAATRAATRAATYAATYAATRDATSDATSDATYAATVAATRAATYAATRDATSAPTSGRLWYTDLGPAMAKLARSMGGAHAAIFLGCAAGAYRMWNGGNQWSGWVAFLSFFRHVAKLSLDYTTWRHYETAALAGPRIMHAEFCMVSDRPVTLTVDAENRPHCDDGPFCAWSDGTSLYAIHGTRVPQFVVEHPETITVADIEAEQNAEVRRVMIERYGLSRYVRDAKFEVLDSDVDPLGQPRRLLRRERLTIVELTNSTEDGDGSRRKYHIPTHPELRPLLPDGGLGEPQKLTALNAVASTYGLRGEEYLLSKET